MSDNIVAPTRRRLTDLWVTGKEVELTDDHENEEPVTIWLSKISPAEQKECHDRATSSRARILAIKNSPLHAEERLQYEDQAIDLGIDSREAWMEFLALSDLQELELSCQERVAAEEEWNKNDYLDALQRAWNEGLNKTYADDPEDEEAKRVFDELSRYSEQVYQIFDEERPSIFVRFEAVSDDDLLKQVVDKIIDTESDFMWMEEFSRWQLFYAVREPNAHKVRYFVDKSEVDALDPRIINDLLREYNEMTVDGLEGKDSQETPSS